MSGLAGLLAGHHPPGVYRWEATFDPDDVAHSVALAGWRSAYVDGVGVESKQATLVAIGEALEFPEYYGQNLDALWDCLRDVETPTVLLWDAWGWFAWADRPGFDLLVRVLRERCESGGFAVLLRGEGPDVDVPVLE